MTTLNSLRTISGSPGPMNAAVPPHARTTIRNTAEMAAAGGPSQVGAVGQGRSRGWLDPPDVPSRGDGAPAPYASAHTPYTATSAAATQALPYTKTQAPYFDAAALHASAPHADVGASQFVSAPHLAPGYPSLGEGEHQYGGGGELRGAGAYSDAGAHHQPQQQYRQQQIQQQQQQQQQQIQQQMNSSRGLLGIGAMGSERGVQELSLRDLAARGGNEVPMRELVPK